MKCPYCSYLDSSVADTRNSSTHIKRKRVCNQCNRRFFTQEKIKEYDFKVIKKSKLGNENFVYENFNYEKLKKSIVAACGKKTDATKIKQIIDCSLDRILSKEIKQIQSSEIGDIILEEIGKVSPSAYLRFACEYMGLNSLEEVKKLIHEFKK